MRFPLRLSAQFCALAQLPLGRCCSYQHEHIGSRCLFLFIQRRCNYLSGHYGCNVHISTSCRLFLITLPHLTPQCGSVPFSTYLCGRRFRGTTANRPHTFAEISEACGILGVDVDCDEQKLKKVYRELVRKHHPDAGGDEAVMSRITVAYDRVRGMSKLEKEQFKTQRNAYRMGSYYGSSSSNNSHNNSKNGGTGYYSTSAGYSAQNAHSASGGGRGFYDTSNADYFAQGQGGRRHSYYAYQQRGRTYGENPFSSDHPFSFYTQLRRAWTMPLSSIILRGVVVYLVLSVIFLMMYRRYRDWLHDDGWKMSESLARHEQLAELHRVRQEMNERIQAAREAAAAAAAAAAHNSGARAFLSHGDSTSNADYNAVTLANGREIRALEYARRRQMEMSEEAKGWPKFGEEKGQLIRRAQDPPGVVFFEPRKADLLSRQAQNLQLGREWSDRQQNAIEVKQRAVPTEKNFSSHASASSFSDVSRSADVVSNISSFFSEALGADKNMKRSD